MTKLTVNTLYKIEMENLANLTNLAAICKTSSGMVKRIFWRYRYALDSFICKGPAIAFQNETTQVRIEANQDTINPKTAGGFNPQVVQKSSYSSRSENMRNFSVNIS